MFTLNCKGRLLVVDKPIVMGILNTTPDSFYSGSRFMDTALLVQQAMQMWQQGAAVIDLGAQSTRPGSERIGAAEEIDRVLPAIEALVRAIPDVVLSIDTYWAKVAAAAVNAGARWVNDISAGLIDPDMLDTVARLGVPYVCMHMKGRPDTMQFNPQYDALIPEIIDFFIERLDSCSRAGINDVLIDPGIGFGKTIDQNLELVRELHQFQILGRPVLLGVSRKSTIYKTLGTDAAGALNGSSVLHTVGLLQGAMVLRAHDVREAVECIQLVNRLLAAGAAQPHG